MNLLKMIAALSFVLAGLAALAVDNPPVAADAERPVTLLGTLAEWKYPDSKMPHGASMGDGGNPDIQDLKCQAILSTPDSFEKVVEFYSTKHGIARNGAKATPTNAGLSVIDQGDSAGRPVSVQVISVNKAESTTTLVISRGEQEKETHIAWSHYMRFGKIAPKE